MSERGEMWGVLGGAGLQTAAGASEVRVLTVRSSVPGLDGDHQRRKIRRRGRRDRARGVHEGHAGASWNNVLRPVPQD